MVLSQLLVPLFGFTLVRRLTSPRKMLTIGLIGILFATCIGTISNIMAGSPNLPYFLYYLQNISLFQQTFVSPVTWYICLKYFHLECVVQLLLLPFSFYGDPTFVFTTISNTYEHLVYLILFIFLVLLVFYLYSLLNLLCQKLKVYHRRY